MSDLEEVYLVVGSRAWNRRVFDEQISKLPGRWHFYGKPNELTIAAVRDLSPRYIFFIHWSWRVPEELIAGYECVCFHMTDVPYGRGGSPLQNLIQAGHSQTKLTALRMTKDLDAGPVYLKEDLSLAGCAEEVYVRAAHQSAYMIASIIRDKPEPVEQTGEPTVFRRRRPEESEIPTLESLQGLHDFIRMLDAEGYPKAFLLNKGFRYEFHRAVQYDGRIVADVTITRIAETEQ